MKKFITSPFMPELVLFLALTLISAMTSFAAVIVLAACLDIGISLYARKHIRRNSLTTGQD